VLAIVTALGAYLVLQFVRVKLDRPTSEPTTHEG